MKQAARKDYSAIYNERQYKLYVALLEDRYLEAKLLIQSAVAAVQGRGMTIGLKPLEGEMRKFSNDQRFSAIKPRKLSEQAHVPESASDNRPGGAACDYCGLLSDFWEMVPVCPGRMVEGKG